jgi:3-methylfumaryl-CoA hydratase
MTSIDLDHLRRWVGRSRADEDIIASRHARLMAATVSHPSADAIRDGAALPALWHWIYFLEGAPARELGRDGHPARGGFLPPVPLANRMWAGGRVEFLAPVILGATVRRTSTVVRVDHKSGRSGDLVFVTVLHEFASPAGETLVREEHDIVYREPSCTAGEGSGGHARSVAASRSSARAGNALAPGTLRVQPPARRLERTIVPTSTLLFRYSALTFNGHRIHYDADYCRDVEGYPNLVVHGPLLATMLANLAEEVCGGRLASFTYRAVSPAFLGDVLTLRTEARERHVGLQAALADGRVCMKAEATIA